MLQSRLVAYADAQRYRLGINYQQLPINQPKNRYHNNHNEGSTQFIDKTEEVRLQLALPAAATAAGAAGWLSLSWPLLWQAAACPGCLCRLST